MVAISSRTKSELGSAACWSLSNPLSFFFFFNQRIVALQYCVGFCHTATWISHRYTYVPSLSDLPPTSHPIPPSQVVTERGISTPICCLLNIQVSPPWEVVVFQILKWTWLYRYFLLWRYIPRDDSLTQGLSLQVALDLYKFIMVQSLICRLMDSDSFHTKDGYVP